jgi:transcriptional regulator with XRE-family HTH domain
VTKVILRHTNYIVKQILSEIIELGEIMDSLGKNMEFLRKVKGWSQIELAKSAGLSPGTISRLESGDIGYSKESLKKIAGALKVSVDQLLGADIEGTRGIVKKVPNLANAKDYMYSPLYVSDAAVFIEVLDGAMEHQLAKGDRVLADPAVLYEAGSLVVARTDKRFTGIVRLFRPRTEEISDGYDLVPTNSIYPAIPCEEPGCEIIGTAVALFRTL